MKLSLNENVDVGIHIALYVAALDPKFPIKKAKIYGPIQRYMVNGTDIVSSDRYEYLLEIDGEIVGNAQMQLGKVVEITLESKQLKYLRSCIDTLEHQRIAWIEVPGFHLGFVYCIDAKKMILAYTFDGPPASYSEFNLTEFWAFLADKSSKSKQN